MFVQAVAMGDGMFGSWDCEHFTFRGVELHLPLLLPPLNGVDVLLEQESILLAPDLLLEDAIVCEQTDSGMVDVFWKIVDKDRNLTKSLL